MNLFLSDCLYQLKSIEDNSVDSLITDPPAGIGFMGKDWDKDRGGRDQWISWMKEIMQECFRVMKPGAHGLVWALPRTSHWTATALEDAGFEIRDVITHLFGSGFPKSLDISKAIDKAAGTKRQVIGIDPVRASKLKNQTTTLTTAQGWVKAGQSINITVPTTDEAKQWQGFGTALKPASEHWILVRKPLSESTVAKNVLKYGTGALNIDECRIPAQNRRSPCGADGKVHRTTGNAYGKHKQSDFDINQGRFPANLVLSHSPHCTEDACDMWDCAVALLDEQSGVSKPQKSRTISVNPNDSIGTFKTRNRQTYVPADKGGGASRFFYCSKISPSERVDSTHPTMKSLKLMKYLITLITPPNGIVLDPFMGSGSTGVAAKELGFQFIGIEKEKEYFDIAQKRIESLLTTNNCY